MKGLKSLSQISKQSPEYLAVFAVGTIARLLGRHVRNLRSQVARAACLAAGDVFSSQIRGIDQVSIERILFYAKRLKKIGQWKDTAMLGPSISYVYFSLKLIIFPSSAGSG